MWGSCRPQPPKNRKESSRIQKTRKPEDQNQSSKSCVSNSKIPETAFQKPSQKCWREPVSRKPESRVSSTPSSISVTVEVAGSSTCISNARSCFTSSCMFLILPLVKSYDMSTGLPTLSPFFFGVFMVTPDSSLITRVEPFVPVTTPFTGRISFNPS